jgi:hypothetical protein
MDQDLIFGVELPVVLAFGLLVFLSLAVARVLAVMGTPAPVRAPRRMAPCDIDREEAVCRY